MIVHCDWSISKFCASLIVLSGVRLIDYLVTYRQRHTFTKNFTRLRETTKLLSLKVFLALLRAENSRGELVGLGCASWLAESQKPDAVALHCSARVPS
jgi:hypothetical protein